ncbi:hypothetical protein ACFOON_09940 [Novosphingobium piscinae]|uniref:DUF11 domain-containing protein n=1 Tax=Novosphingobium piscinae TaxID=1507448 RepID=A0A7X1G032_9SPHN|nr:hypothetical protein [Novosphingobium piscinae]MBC2670176.1 hypothetical protein [Novosphingobium piscinae]
MFRSLLIAIAAALAAPLALLPAPALAADTATSPVALTGEVKVDRVVTENGATRHVLVQPDKVVPGERLVFTTRYRNTGAKPIQNFVVTNPVPAAVVLADNTDRALVVSVDGGTSWGPLASLTVPDGAKGRRAAGPADVTHLRWTIPVIAPGADGAVEYHATVR